MENTIATTVYQLIVKFKGDIKMKKTKLNKKLLLELLYAETPYGEEDLVVNIITRELDKLGFTYYQDKAGNLVAQRGKADKYPLLNAHMDIVDLAYFYYPIKNSGKKSKNSYVGGYHDYYDEMEMLLDSVDTNLLSECVDCKDCTSYRECIGFEGEGIIPEDSLDICAYFSPTVTAEGKLTKWGEQNGLFELGYYDEISAYKIVEEKGKISGKGKYRVLGGDDKCGIFLALEIARNTEMPLKLLFTVGEELGCLGIKQFVKTSPEWFKNVAYSITIDRRGGDNLLSSQLGVRSCTRKFAAELAMAGIMESIPVKIEDGSVADVIYIRELVKDAVNISAGYHNAHDEDEFIIWSEVEGIFRWVKRFMESY